MDYIFFIAIIPITIIVLVIIIVFILLSRNKSKNSQQPDIIVNNYDYTNQVNRISQTEPLLDLKKLYDADILTEEEFNEQKNKILNS